MRREQGVMHDDFRAATLERPTRLVHGEVIVRCDACESKQA